MCLVLVSQARGSRIRCCVHVIGGGTGGRGGGLGQEVMSDAAGMGLGAGDTDCWERPTLPNLFARLPKMPNRDAGEADSSAIGERRVEQMLSSGAGMRGRVVP